MRHVTDLWTAGWRGSLAILCLQAEGSADAGKDKRSCQFLSSDHRGGDHTQPTFARRQAALSGDSFAAPMKSRQPEDSAANASRTRQLEALRGQPCQQPSGRRNLEIPQGTVNGK